MQGRRPPVEWGVAAHADWACALPQALCEGTAFRSPADLPGAAINVSVARSGMTLSEIQQRQFAEHASLHLAA